MKLLAERWKSRPIHITPHLSSMMRRRKTVECTSSLWRILLDQTWSTFQYMSLVSNFKLIIIKKEHSVFQHYLKQPKNGFLKLIHFLHQIVQDLLKANQLLRASLNSLLNCHGCPQQTMVVQKSLVTSLRSLTHRQECGDGP